MLHRTNLKTQQSPVILDLRLRITQHGNRMIILLLSFSKSFVFKMLPSTPKGGKERKRTIFASLKWGRGSPDVPFILSKIVGLSVHISLSETGVVNERQTFQRTR